MNHALVLRLIKKDWYLRPNAARAQRPGGSALGRGSLPAQRGRRFRRAQLRAIVLVMVAILLPMNTIVNERKRQNLAFVMSLPISAMDYTTGEDSRQPLGFLVVWLVVAFAVIGTFADTGVFGELIPLPSGGGARTVCRLLVCCLRSPSSSNRSSGRCITMATCNVSYMFLWFFALRIPSVREGPLTVPCPSGANTLLPDPGE